MLKQKNASDYIWPSHFADNYKHIIRLGCRLGVEANSRIRITPKTRHLPQEARVFCFLASASSNAVSQPGLWT